MPHCAASITRCEGFLARPVLLASARELNDPVALLISVISGFNVVESLVCSTDKADDNSGVASSWAAALVALVRVAAWLVGTGCLCGSFSVVVVVDEAAAAAVAAIFVAAAADRL